MMAWFITKAHPSLAVRCEDGSVIRFRHAEIRTTKPAELAALRAHTGVIEVIEDEVVSVLRRHAVALGAKVLHDLERRRYQCEVPSEVLDVAQTDEIQPDGWKLYRRRIDAFRWNPGLTECPYCTRE